MKCAATHSRLGGMTWSQGDFLGGSDNAGWLSSRFVLFSSTDGDVVLQVGQSAYSATVIRWQLVPVVHHLDSPNGARGHDLGNRWPDTHAKRGKHASNKEIEMDAYMASTRSGIERCLSPQINLTPPKEDDARMKPVNFQAGHTTRLGTEA